jgi:hypothetical protein
MGMISVRSRVSDPRHRGGAVTAHHRTKAQPSAASIISA